MKILIVRNDNIGDLINTTPAIEALRKRYPEAQIDIVVNSLNRCAIDGNPFVNTIYCYSKAKHKKGWKTKLKVLLEKRRLLKQIHRVGYDLAILFRYDFSPSSIQWIKASRAPTTIGVENPKGANVFTDNVKPNPKDHEVLLCFSLLKPLGIKYEGEKTRFDIPEEMKKPYALWQGCIGFHCSSRRAENKYPFSHFLQIANGLKDQNVVITAEPADFAQAEKLATESGATFIKTKSFQDCAALMSQAKLILTLDGGIAHVGPALGVRTVTLLGKNNIDRWHPWGAKELTLETPSHMCSEHKPEAVLAILREHIQ